jgi:hypothetical protein
MLSIYLTITVLDIIHHPVFYLNYDVSETEFCLRLLKPQRHRTCHVPVAGWRPEVNVTGSGSCPEVDVCINDVEPSGSSPRELVWLECQSSRKSDICILLSSTVISNLFSACHAYNQAVSSDWYIYATLGANHRHPTVRYHSVRDLSEPRSTQEISCHRRHVIYSS